MPRYLIERTFPDGLSLPGPDQDARTRLEFIENNTLDEVTWVHSYVLADGNKSYCIYDAPTPEALRRASRRNGLPIDRILEVSVLEPYFYIEKVGPTGSTPSPSRRSRHTGVAPDDLHGNGAVENLEDMDWNG